MSIYSGPINELLGFDQQQIAYLEAQGYSQFEVIDTAVNIEALSAPQIASLALMPVEQIQAVDNSVSLSAAQAIALEAGDVVVTAPSSDTVTLMDTVANLEGLTGAQLSALTGIGVTAVTVADTAANLLAVTSADTAALAAVNAAIGASGQPNYEVIDTAENVLANFNALQSDAAVSTIDVTNSFDTTSALLINAGPGLELSDGSTNFGGPVSGAGTLQMESGTFELNDNLQISVSTWSLADLNSSDTASISLAGDLTYGGTFLDGYNGYINLDGHVLTLSGDNSMLGGWANGPTGSLIVTGTADVSTLAVGGDVVLEDRGSITQNSFLDLGLTNGDTAELKVDSGADYLLKGSGIYDGSSGTTLLNNEGTFEVSGDGQESTIQTAVKTTGTFAIDGGALLDLSGSTLTNDGLVTVGDDATLKVAGSVGADTSDVGRFDIEKNGTIEFGAAVADDQTVTFDSDGTGTLRLDDLVQFNAAIKGVEAGDTIFISDAGLGNFSSITDATVGTYNATTDTTSVVLDDNGNTVATLLFDGNYAADSFSVTPVGGAVAITDPPCYCRGTLICTERGEVAVEDLAIGDKVMTMSGAAQPIKWIGQRNVIARYSDRLRAWPIRVKANALAEGVPSRDLLVSPDHALLIDGILIQAGALVNGVSIVRETDVPEVFTYFHVELNDHALIFAENTLAETFIDNVDRLGFDNWREHQVLYPDGHAIVELPYPRAKASRQVPRAIREQLAARFAHFCDEITEPHVECNSTRSSQAHFAAVA